MPHDVSCPAYYAILPIVPLVLITVFSFIPSINLDVVTANLIGLFFVFILELVRRRDRKEVTSDFSVVMKAMGNSFANVVSILIGAAVFAEAIKMLGGITIISNTLAAVKSAPIITMALMSMITFFAGMLLGSGNASWYAFGPLVPDVTAQMGVSTATIALPMQLSSGIGRCMSPDLPENRCQNGLEGTARQEKLRRLSCSCDNLEERKGRCKSDMTRTRRPVFRPVRHLHCSGF